MNLKKMRADFGITQKRLSDLSGLDVRWVRKLENGEILFQNITVSNALRLVKAMAIAARESGLGVSSDDYQYLKDVYVILRSLG